MLFVSNTIVMYFCKRKSDQHQIFWNQYYQYVH